MSHGLPNPRGALAKVLSPLGGIYGALAAWRRRLHARGILPSAGLDVPVISVGNLVVGGTGKTPLVARLLDVLPAGLSPALVLARGYGRRFTRGGETLNDEGHLVRARHPGHRFAQGADRLAAARPVLAAGGVRSIILDDGAQHLRIRRDLELLVFDVRDLLAPRRCLPAGAWREPLDAVSAAAAVVLTHCDRVAAREVAAARSIIEPRLRPGAPLLETRHAPRDVMHRDGRSTSPTTLRGARVALVSGIARPHSFEATARDLGCVVVSHRVFSDHHDYRAADLRALAVDGARADFVLTTEKDAVKLDGVGAEVDLRTLRIDLDFGVRADVLQALLAALPAPVAPLLHDSPELS